MSNKPLNLTHEVIVDCPRCHEQCGWCSDYRHMHGMLTLSGSGKKCTQEGMVPEGNNCPLCKGSRRVKMVQQYTGAV